MKFILISIALVCTQVILAQTIPPPAPSIDSMSILDTLHGYVINDPYRGIENIDNDTVAQWLQAQKNYALETLQNLPLRDTLLSELKKYRYATNVKTTLPEVVNDSLFYVRSFLKEGIDELVLQDQNSQAIPLFSTETINSDSVKHKINFFMPSPKGSYVVMGLSSRGEEIATLRIYDVKQRVLLDTKIPRTLLGIPQWVPDETGFFYHQFQDTQNSQAIYLFSRSKYHKLGTPTTDDQIVLSANQVDSLGALDFPLIYTFPNSEYILGAVYRGVEANASLYVTERDKFLSGDSIEWTNIASFNDRAEQFALHGNKAFILKYSDNANGELVTASLSGIKRNSADIIAQSSGDTLLSDIALSSDALYLQTSYYGTSKLYRYELAENSSRKEVPLPYRGAVSLKNIMNSKSYTQTKGLYFSMQSWTKGSSIFYFNPKTNQTKQTSLQPQSIYDSNTDLVVENAEIVGHDGEVVPLSIIHSRSFKYDGTNPTLLLAYGAYGISMNPFFNSILLPWLNRGGIYAIAHVRGGGEKGKAWHEGGRLLNKPNSWKDFIACAKHLIDKKYTSPDKLAGWGGSAGCITVGRGIIEEPLLFKAGVLQVGILNPLRFEFTPNNTNTTEFGTSTDSLQFLSLLETDPYMHVDKDQSYPGMLITAGMEDPRVVIWQPAKMVARLQSVQNQPPILFRINDNAGHFGGTGDNLLKEYSDMFAFLLWQLNEVGEATARQD